jgi:SAM-dependent methyltransferase
MHKRPTHRPKPPARPAPAQPPRETHWAEVADWYDKLVGDEGSEYHQHVVIPGIIRMLDLHEKLKIKNEKSKITPPLTLLDLACGQGVVSRKLAALGCTVIGLDAAAPLIEAADRRNQIDRLPIRYAVADATKLLDDAGKPVVDIAPNSLDAITLILAIQNITPLSPVWQGCRTLLKPGGSLIIVMMHPAFRVPKQSDWIWEDRGGGGVGEQGRVIKQYLTSSKVDIQTHPGLAAHGKDASSTPHFHRPLQAYVNTLGNAGLLIDHLEEWISHKVSQPGPKKAALDRARKEIPMFLALRAKKARLAGGYRSSP